MMDLLQNCCTFFAVAIPVVFVLWRIGLFIYSAIKGGHGDRR